MNLVQLDDVQLLQGERMFRIVQVPDQIEDFSSVERIPEGGVQFAGEDLALSQGVVETGRGVLEVTRRHHGGQDGQT